MTDIEREMKRQKMMLDIQKTLAQHRQGLAGNDDLIDSLRKIGTAFMAGETPLMKELGGQLLDLYALYRKAVYNPDDASLSEKILAQAEKVQELTGRYEQERAGIPEP